jgi:dipeptidyl-peptidase-3
MKYRNNIAKWAIPVIALISLQMINTGCKNTGTSTTQTQGADGYDSTFKVEAQAFGDIQVLRYQVPGFNSLSLNQKKLAYYLYEAALSGRDIIYDQKSPVGLMIRKTLETIYGTYKGNRTTEDWKKFEEYCGKFWFSNGNHHHYGNEKFIPECSDKYFASLLKDCDTTQFLKHGNANAAMFGDFVIGLIYDPLFEPKVVDQRPNIDNIVNSSNNFYEKVTQKEVEDFYSKFDTKGNAPSWGLNSKLMKENGQIVEKVWKSGGMYGAAIDRIIDWLQKASSVAEDKEQKDALDLLIQYYKTGDLKTWDNYNIAWVKDTASRIDNVNGFIEVYLDAIGKKASFEGTVSLKDMEETKRIKAIAEQAQWFEDNSPIAKEH